MAKLANKWRRISSSEHVEGVRVQIVLVDNLQGRDQMEDMGVDGWITFKCLTKSTGLVTQIQVSQNMI
jgi:hypothetical protein